jgi:putative transcriptional regulator
MIICRLNLLLEKKEMSRYELQKLSGVSYPTLSQMFHGESSSYNVSVLDRLCKVLECQPGDLLKWKPARFPRLKS